MADINKFTTKEVLNKVLLDSSGNSVAAFSHTSQEAFNAVLDSTNSRLNVSLSGGTISGDVTISGDLTVEGNGSGTYDEIIQGNLALKEQASASARLLYHDTDDALLWTVGVARTTNDIETGSANLDLVLASGYASNIIFANKPTESMRIDSSGRVIIGHTTNVALGTTDPALQVLGTGEDDSQISIGRFSADDTAPKINLVKGRGGIGANTIVTDNDNLGTINFRGADGSDLDTIGASIEARVNGTPGANDLPTELIFSTTADNTATPAARLILDPDSSISLGNNDAGTANTLFGYKAGENLVSGSANNVYIGNTAGRRLNNAANDSNVAIGSAAMLGASSGTVSAAKNIGIGVQALQNITTGEDNVAVGDVAMLSITEGLRNVAIGSSALTAITDGDENIAIGKSALLAMTTGNGNIAIGQSAMSSADGGEGNNIAIGIQTMNLVNADAADHNIAMGYQAGQSMAGDNNIAIGQSTMNNGSNAADGVVAIGKFAVQGALGSGADSTVAIGQQALQSLTSGASNTAVGFQSGNAITGNSFGTFIGYDAGKLVTGGNNTIIGAVAGDALTSGQANVAVGTSALGAATGAVNYCVALGEGALAGSLVATGDDPSGAVGIGYQSGVSLTAGRYSTFVGYQSGYSANSVDGSTFVGYMAGFEADANTVAAHHNTYIGAFAGRFLDDGSDNVAVGYEAMSSNSDGSANSTNKCIAIGYQAMNSPVTEAESVSIGYQSMGNCSNGSNNVMVGYFSGKNMTAGNDNNTGIGHTALGGTHAGASEKNTAVGSLAMAGAVNGADNNTAVGFSSLTAVTEGDSNVAVGANAGDVITTGLNNTIVGKGSDPSANNATNQTVIGFAVTGITDNSVVLGNAAVTKVYMSSDGDAEIYANGTINTSDRRLKENIEDSDLGLEFVNKLRPVKYNYIKDKHDGKTKYGIIAQEVQKVLKESNNEDFAGIKDSDEYLGADYIQFVAPLIKSVQELSAKVEELEAKLSK